MELLDLPYDIRYKIYEHLFPPGQQIYIQVLRDSFRSITPEHKIPTGLLLTCKALHTEASEYLYNSYLFNIIGHKADCLGVYYLFLHIIKKHARNEVHVDAFSNGDHSSTMCLTIQAGEARMGIMNRRERGEHKKIDELMREVGAKNAGGRRYRHSLISYFDFSRMFKILAGVAVLLAMAIAWWLH